MNKAIQTVTMLLSSLSMMVSCHSTNRSTLQKQETMFTVAQIKAAHSKVKSGADFPKYIQEIKQMGVTGFETWVKDSHTEYFGKEGYQTQSEPMYALLTISDTLDRETFTSDLKAHQQGKTDYFTFCKDCAKTGIEKWVVNLDAMTCIYFDKSGHQVWLETIPTP